MLPTIEQQIEMKCEMFRRGHFEALDLTKKQLALFRALFDKTTDEILFGGAAGGGKSFGGGEWEIWCCLSYPGTRWFVGRKYLTQIRNSTVVTIRKIFKKHGIDSSYYKYDDNSVEFKFKNGSLIKGLELHYKPSSDPEFDSFGSAEFTGGWIEEGGGVTAKAYEIISVRIGRHLNDQYGIKGKLLITANPTKNFLYRLFYKPFCSGTLPPTKKFIQSLVTDNTKGESDYERRLNNLTGKARARLYLGDWEFDNDPTCLVLSESAVDIFTNKHVLPLGKKYIAADLAMHGADKFVVGVWHGWVLIELHAFSKMDAKEIELKIVELQKKHSIPNSNTIYDADGLGTYLQGYMRGAVAFRNGSKALNDENFENLKTQCYYKLADIINSAQIYIPCVGSLSEQELIIEELMQVKSRDADLDDKPKKILQKDDVKQNIGRSPDYSDMLAMRCYFDIAKPRTVHYSINTF